MWTKQEDDVIRKKYPSGGYKAVLNDRLFKDGHRTALEIEARASVIPIDEVTVNKKVNNRRVRIVYS